MTTATTRNRHNPSRTFASTLAATLAAASLLALCLLPWFLSTEAEAATVGIRVRRRTNTEPEQIAPGDNQDALSPGPE